MSLSPEQESKAKLIKDFRKRTEEEVGKVAERLLSKPTDVYEIDFGWITLHFHRMSLADRLDLERTSERPLEEQIDKAAEMLGKYNEDGQSKQTWLEMAHSDREPEFNKIFSYLTALSVYPDDPMQFFRHLDTWEQLGRNLQIPPSRALRDRQSSS